MTDDQREQDWRRRAEALGRELQALQLLTTAPFVEYEHGGPYLCLHLTRGAVHKNLDNSMTHFHFFYHPGKARSNDYCYFIRAQEHYDPRFVALVRQHLMEELVRARLEGDSCAEA